MSGEAGFSKQLVAAHTWWCNTSPFFKQRSNVLFLKLISSRHRTRRRRRLSSPVCAQVDAADAQVVAAADEARLQFQGRPVGGHGLLRAAAVGQRGAQLVPEQVVLESRARQFV